MDFSLLEKSINRFIKKNELLRAKLIEKDGEPRQYISPYNWCKLGFADFSLDRNGEAVLQDWVDKTARKPFQLTESQLFYFCPFKVSNDDNGYLVKFHHLISDGWSMKVMTDQIADIYMKLLSGEDIEEDDCYSISEYIGNEEKYLGSARFLKNKVFWNEKYRSLPKFVLTKDSASIEGKRRTFQLDRKISLRIQEFIHLNNCSMNTFFIMIFLIYLYITTRQDEIVLGTPVYNRSGRREKRAFGMFTSIMPFRFALNPGITARELLKGVNGELTACYLNQKYPYDLLARDLELKKKGYDHLFNIFVNYYNTKLKTKLGSLSVDNYETYSGYQIYSLQLVVKDWSDTAGFMLSYDYKIDDFTDSQIDAMHIHLINLINRTIDHPGAKVAGLSLLCQEEQRKFIGEFNSTGFEYPREKTVVQIFQEQVERTPDKTAVSCEGQRLTYRQLNERANNLAWMLIKKGVKQEIIVGLLTFHSIETVIGILGILKAGGAYLPIDPDYPPERTNYLLRDSGVKILLTNFDMPAGIHFQGETIKLIGREIYSENTGNPDIISQPENLVYVIYTSGSTGNPKGVMVEHRALANYIWWVISLYVKGNDEVFPLYSSLAFDLTVTSVYTPLLSGNKIAVYREGGNEFILDRILKDNKATIVKATPSHLRRLNEGWDGSSSVKVFIVGGEDLKVSLARDLEKKFDGSIEIYNEYGPTEAVVGCMIHKFDSSKDVRLSVPVGVPGANARIYLLDKNLNPVPPGIPGEICISGDCLARGYLNRTGLTFQKFLDDPFVHGAKMYKTGDLARFLDDGEIEYIGREDQQVKINGYRVELGEIERCLLNHPAVKNSLVAEQMDRDKNMVLCAYIVKKSPVSSKELRSHLSRYLPHYMIPHHFFEVKEIPLSVHGKVIQGFPAEAGFIKNKDQTAVGYRNEAEKALIRCIGEALGLEKVSLKDHFFQLGGDSIKAIQISSKLDDLGFVLKTKDMLSFPVIEEMTSFLKIKKKLNNSAQSISEGVLGPLPIYSWFLSRNFQDPHYYHQSVFLEIREEISPETLESAFNELVRHHDALRLNYNSKTGDIYFNNEHLTRTNQVGTRDLNSCCDKPEKLVQIATAIKANFDIEKDLLIKLNVFDFGNGDKRLLLIAHHMITDGVSLRIILNDLYHLINQLSSHQEMKLPQRTDSIQKWAEVLKEYSQASNRNELEYWQSVLACPFVFPADFNLGEDTLINCRTITCRLNREETNRLLRKVNFAYHTKTHELIITALLLAVREFTNSDEILIELEGHGREEEIGGMDLSRTVGWFTSIYPALLRVSGDTRSAQIKEVKEQLRNIPNNGLGFGVLKYLSGLLVPEEQKYIRFNFLGDFGTEFNNEIFHRSEDFCGSDISKDNYLTCLMDINAYIEAEVLYLHCTYSTNKFKEETVNRFMETFTSGVLDVSIHCADKERVEYTPSDFDAVDITQEELNILFE